MMFNQVMGRLGLKLTITFELVHNSKPNSNTWFELYSIGYFNHRIANTDRSTKRKYHTLDGIAVDKNDKSKIIILINLSLTVTIARLLSASMNQDSPSLTSRIPSAFMSALPMVYLETINTQFMSPSHQVPKYQFNIKISYSEAPSTISHFQCQ